MEKARVNGVAVLASRNSQHLGALWPDVEPFAREGLAISMVNSMAEVVPYGAGSRSMVPIRWPLRRPGGAGAIP